MRILITGATGLVGRHLLLHWLQQPGMVLAGTGRRAVAPAHFPAGVQYLPLDITDAGAVQATLRDFAPDVVVHSAAMSKPNDCELQQPLCYAVNVNGTRHVWEACEQLRCRLVFMSTDFVFGDEGPYDETAAYSPVNYYGQTKVWAEELLQAATIDCAIVRTVLVYGPQLPGLLATFPQWVQAQLAKGQPIRVFTDQYRTATFIADLVGGISAIVKQQASGVYHLCGPELVTPYDLAQRVAQYLGYSPALVQPVTRAELAEAARRPINSSLLIDKARRELGYEPRGVDVGACF